MLKLYFCAIAVHLLFLYSVFDLYFTSPLVHAAKRHSVQYHGAAERLVLFVCDGLRVDKFFQNHVKYAPYLRSLMQKGAIYGISNTKVPTESRPGHVAMIAGFYEDVAAITKGWKENPVEFDSLFNQSRHTWSWGSPDILPMFSRGAVSGRVTTDMYDSSFEDFAKNGSILDAWVFDHVFDFFSENKENPILRMDELVFFLHLLGTDTIGHADKPHSPKYTNNIAFVDQGVEKIVGLFNRFYGDDKTAFIFSSDHGMRDWGSHGAGHPDETMTPFIGWGAGFTEPIWENEEKSLDFSNISGFFQMGQADIAPLMSCLIGSNYPANSVGKVPIDLLNVDDKYKASCLFANAQQLAETAVNLHKTYKEESLLSFSPYPDFDIDLIEQTLLDMKFSAEKGRLKSVVKQADIFIEHMLAASQYYHTYNNAYIGFAVTSGFLLWIVYVISDLMRSADIERYRDRTIYNWKDFTFISLYALVVMILLLKRSPLSHYAYWLVPIFFGCEFIFSLQAQQNLIRTFLGSASNIVSFFAVLGGLEAVVWAYWYRRSLVVSIVGTGIFSTTFVSSKQWKFYFPAAILCLVIFPMLPPADSGQQAFELVYTVGLIAFVLVMFSFKDNYFKPHCTAKCRLARAVQLFLLIVALIVKFVTVVAVSWGRSVPLICHFSSWILLFAVWPPIFYTCSVRPGRIFAIFLSLFTIYTLLSVYYESLYLFVLAIVLLIWTNRQKMTRDEINFSSVLGDAFLLVILINVSLLAPANVAVINSFDLVSVYTFLTLFAPFVIMTLLIIKVVIPVLCVVLAFVEICHINQYSFTTALLLVMALSDFTALHFFFSVRTEGSWLEIGTSLSHYCIQMFTAVALIPLVAFSHILIKYQIDGSKSDDFKTA